MATVIRIFFADLILVTKILQTQNSLHRLVSGDNKPLKAYMVKMLQSMADLITHVVGRNTQLLSEAKEFSLFLQHELRLTVLPKGFQNSETFSKKALLKLKYSSKYFRAIPFIHGHLCNLLHHYGMAIDWTDAKTICVIGNMRNLIMINEGVLWGIDDSDHLISIETARPDQTRSLINDNSYYQICHATEIN